MIRLATERDAGLLQEKAQESRTYPFDAKQLFGRDMSVSVADDAPSFCQLVYFKMHRDQVALMPRGLRTLLTKSGGWNSQVSEFWPLSASDGQATARKLPLLASALRAMGARHPESLPRPVWAAFDGVDEADAVALVALMQLAFPQAEAAGRFIWMPTLRGARDAVAGSAVDV